MNFEAKFTTEGENRVRTANVIEMRRSATEIKVQACDDLNGMRANGYVLINGVIYAFEKTKYDLGVWTMKIERV